MSVLGRACRAWNQCQDPDPDLSICRGAANHTDSAWAIFAGPSIELKYKPAVMEKMGMWLDARRPEAALGHPEPNMAVYV